MPDTTKSMPRVMRPRRYPWDKLIVGQTFFVPGRTPSQLASARAYAESRLGREFQCWLAEKHGRTGTTVLRLS